MTKKRVDFDVKIIDGKKYIVLKEKPKKSVTQGLSVSFNEDINEHSTNECKRDLIAGEHIYTYPDVKIANYITGVYIALDTKK